MNNGYYKVAERQGRGKYNSDYPGLLRVDEKKLFENE